MTYQERFAAMTDQELLVALEHDSKNNGWVSQRALYITALWKELEKRKLVQESTIIFRAPKERKD